MKTVEELEKVLEEVRKDLEELKKSKNNFEPTPKDWMPKHGEKYWVANISLEPMFLKNETITDEEFIRYNRIFKTKEECQLYCDIQRAFRDASKSFVVDEDNYCIYYNHNTNTIRFDVLNYRIYQTLCFESKEIVKELINKLGEENVKRYYLGVY